jgi:DNA-binding SARP family transcriptional activator
MTGDHPVALSPGASLLFAYLALSPKEGRSREVVLSQLYADCPTPAARRRLNTALWRLRAEVRLGAGVDIVAADNAHRLALSDAVTVTLDAREFELLVSPILALPPEDLTDAQASLLERAVSLHRGQLCEPCDDDWVLGERARIEDLYLTTLDYLVQHYGARHEVGAIAKYGDMALALEPLREDIHRHLMAAYGAAGRGDLVDRQFERCRAVLLAELGADPLPETIALYSRLTRGAGRPSPTVGAVTAELEHARREIARLSDIVDRALEHLARMS